MWVCTDLAIGKTIHFRWNLFEGSINKEVQEISFRPYIWLIAGDWLLQWRFCKIKIRISLDKKVKAFSLLATEYRVIENWRFYTSVKGGFLSQHMQMVISKWTMTGDIYRGVFCQRTRNCFCIASWKSTKSRETSLPLQHEKHEIRNFIKPIWNRLGFLHVEEREKHTPAALENVNLS